MANYFGVDQPFCKNPKMIEYFKSLPKDPGCTPDHQSCWIPSHIIREGDLNFAPLSKYDVERIGVLGCASHSDFQSERDTVPERLHIWFENYCEGNEDPDLWMAFLHAERTLHKAGSP
jgi:hypothetical protein